MHFKILLVDFFFSLFSYLSETNIFISVQNER